MELHFGLMSMIPPVLTIILALIFKDVILALAAGIFSGALMIAGGNIFTAFGIFTDKTASSLADEWNIRIFLFCALLGGLVAMLNRTGAVRSFGEWAAGKLKSRRGTLFFTFLFGIAIFIDDYFNSLAVGTAMRPVCDRMKIARAKLAYILDSTAAPVCIIAPISSWVVIIMSYTRDAKGFSELGISEFDLFIRLIPYNLYVFLTFLLILLVILLGRDFGPMLRAEQRAKSDEGLFDADTYGEAAVPEDVPQPANGHPFDMIIPISVLILSAVVAFPVTTWKIAAEKADGPYFQSFWGAFQNIGLKDAFCNTDASRALMYSIVFTLIFTVIYFLARRLMSVRDITTSMVSGAQSMTSVLIILTLAWTIGAMIKNSPADGGIGLAEYLSEFAKETQFPFWLVPLSVFALGGLIAFSTGTSWGTMAIMVSIVMPIVVTAGKESGLSGPELLNTVCFTLSATIGGAIFGDHSSPISDTTILSATGAGCPCLEHVATQIPYAALCACSAGFGYFIGSIFGLNIYVAASAALLFFMVTWLFLTRKR